MSPTTSGPAGYTDTAAILEHWDGQQWSNVDNPYASTPEAQLFDVDAISRTDAWAIGYPNILMHWNGHTWKQYHRPR